MEVKYSGDIFEAVQSTHSTWFITGWKFLCQWLITAVYVLNITYTFCVLKEKAVPLRVCLIEQRLISLCHFIENINNITCKLGNSLEKDRVRLHRFLSNFAQFTAIYRTFKSCNKKMGASTDPAAVERLGRPGLMTRKNEQNCNAGYTNWNYNSTRRLDRGKQITLLAWRRNKTIYTMYTSLTGHNRPFSTVPEELGNGQLIRVWSPPQLLQWCRYLQLPKGQLHCTSFHEWQKGGTRLVSLIPWKKTTEVAGVKPWLETLSESCIDQSLRPETAASFLNTRSYFNQAEPEKWRMNDKQLILGQVGPTMSMNSAQHPLKNNEGVGPSQNVFFFHLPAFWRRNHEHTIKEHLQLLLRRSEIYGKQICHFDKLATYNFRHQLWRNRGMPRTNSTSLLRLR